MPVVEPAREADRQTVEDLLASCGLPLDGLRDCYGRFVVAIERGEAGAPTREIVGCAGLEVHGTHCILRSLAVHPRARGTGVVRDLIEAILERARESGCTDAWLLTRTVEKMALRRGFAKVDRCDVPRELSDTTEFAINACATAIVMRKNLQLSLDNGSSTPV